MSEISDLVNQARALGESIARHARVQAYIAARKAVAADASARALLSDYQRATRTLHDLQAQSKPIEPELKRGILDYEQKLASHSALQELMRRQADFIELMNRINRAMEEPIAAAQNSAD